MSRRNSILFLLILFGLFSLVTRGCKTTEPEATAPGAPAEPSPPSPDIPGVDREFRAVWIATVANIDWPSQSGLPVAQQKQELIDILNRAASLHFNAVVFQVRPAADAFYRSSYEPWSSFLTGKMGRPPLPDYDPLEFAVQEAHKRGLELHAWFNPYRAGHPSNRSGFSADHISRTHPEYVVEYGNFLWLDPGLPEVREHTRRVVLDVVKRYDIDAVHFDDYFYPYPSYAGGAEFPDSLSWERALANGVTLSRDEWRRDNVNKLIRELSAEIKQVKPHVKFGISPFGIWQPGHPKNTTGFNAYQELYADARLWLKEGWVDYLSPQLYYRITQIPQPFPIMLSWWVEQNIKGRHIWPGHFTGRIRDPNRYWPPYEILGQVYTAKAFSGVTGSIHFSMKTFMENPEDFNRSISAGPHAFAAAIPASPWLGLPAPSEPDVRFYDYGPNWNLYLEPADETEVKWWSVKSLLNGKWEKELFPGHLRVIRFEGGAAMKRPEEVAVTAIGRSGKASNPVLITTPMIREQTDAGLDNYPFEVVPREDWADRSARGVAANAVELRVQQADTIQFRDLTLIVDLLMQSMQYPPELMEITGDSTSQKEADVTKTAKIKLYKNGASETVSIREGEALNWYGYHIGFLEFGSGSSGSLFEIATVTSLGVDRAAATSTGAPSQRFRVPHKVRNITLYHLPVDSADGDFSPETFLNSIVEESLDVDGDWDIPYHFMIAPDGTIYRGRNEQYAGSARFGYDPRGHLMIGLMTSSKKAVSKSQLERLAELSSYFIDKYMLNENRIYLDSELSGAENSGNLSGEKLLDLQILSRLIQKYDP